MKKVFLLILISACQISCISTKSTLKNVDDNAPNLVLTKNNTFVITEVSKDLKYGYNKDYPVNIYYQNSTDNELNPVRFFDALTGPEGQKLAYKKVTRCCPFPSKRVETGAGLLDIYEVKWEGLEVPKKIYINIYEKGIVMAPVGFTIKK
jgi:hypothetical protein